jgi:thiosulfate dehydrogenase [quinone] large subunit
MATNATNATSVRTNGGDTTRLLVQGGAIVAGLAGAWLFHQALGSNRVTGSSFLLYFLGGLAVLVGTAYALSRHYTPGEDRLSADEVPAQQPVLARFLARSTLAAPLWLGLRLFLAYVWWNGGYHKLVEPKWWSGESLMTSWTRYVTPGPTGAAPAAYEFYRNFLQMLLDTQAYTWFGKVIIFGELAVGLGLLFGVLTGIAAAGGILMNTAFLFAGALSSNPLLLLLEILIVWGWRAAGWLGADRWLLPLLGVPGAPRVVAPGTAPGEAPGEAPVEAVEPSGLRPAT